MAPLAPGISRSDMTLKIKLLLDFNLEIIWAQRDVS
jgi:undecaprenyl pyrophosphate phosphatase UppP